MLVGHCLIGDGGDAARLQQPRLFRIGRQMQIGEEDLAFAEAPAFDGLRLLHLDDQRGLGEHGLGVAPDRGAGLDVLLVAIADADSGAGLDHDLMAAGGQFLDGGGDQPDAIFVNLDFLRDPDAHRPLLGMSDHRASGYSDHRAFF